MSGGRSMQPRYEPRGVEERWQRTWEDGRALQRRARSDADAVRRLPPAAQRDRPPAHRPRAQPLRRRLAHPLEADAGLQHALPARLRPCRHLDPERGRACADRRGHVAPGDRPRRVRGARLGLAARVRRQDPRRLPPHRRVARLPPLAVHDGRRLHPRGDAVLRAPLPARLDLPREPHHQLVPVPRDVALRPRARARGRRRHALDDPLSAGGRRRLHPDRDRASRDDPRRRRGRGASRRRAVQASDRPRGDRAVDREPRAGDRRRARRASSSVPAR